MQIFLTHAASHLYSAGAAEPFQTCVINFGDPGGVPAFTFDLHIIALRDSSLRNLLLAAT